VTVAVVSPGAMGSALGAALVRSGERVVATVAGRSERTARLAEQARLELVPDLRSALADADVILSVVPPAAAPVVASDVVRASAGVAAPLLVDLNAIAPATVRGIASSAADGGVDVVDGSISGPPPWKPGTTRIYVSGARAREVATLPFDGVELIVVGDEVGAASAVKMSTASVYKGTSALLAQALLTAQANGVLEHVLEDLRAGAPELVANVERRLASAAAKSARYVGEMHEIASAQAAVGLTPGLFEAVADIYAAIARTPLASENPEELPPDLALESVLEKLAERRGGSGDRTLTP
jgi:3-hydroxyisobutyrate dehydrogenase-like beta-hydroxyacid dehydrogenase